jgi:uncharacterized membrane protein
MEKDQCDKAINIGPEKAVELLFNDSSKNISDLKSRQWNAANYGVLAIMAVAIFDHNASNHHKEIVTLIMLVIVVCHFFVTYKCHRNLDTFRTRIKTLISSYFDAESHTLFKKGKPEWEQEKELKFPRGKEGQDFEDAVVDEGGIEFALFFTTPVTFIFACFVVWCWR